MSKYYALEIFRGVVSVCKDGQTLMDVPESAVAEILHLLPGLLASLESNADFHKNDTVTIPLSAFDGLREIRGLIDRRAPDGR